jgi:hypothetical protein
MLPMSESLLSFRDLEPGIRETRLHVSALYPTRLERNEFEARLNAFLAADPAAGIITSYTHGELYYQTEDLIPAKTDARHPLLLLFGNPASHSVLSRMFFASEGNNRDHRIWKALRQGKRSRGVSGWSGG